jgi:AmpE protein
MSFLAMIIALLVAQLRDRDSSLFHDRWLIDVDARLRGMGLSPGASLLCSVALPVIGVGVVLSYLEPRLFGLLWIAFTVVILLYSFGRINFPAMLDRYRAYFSSGNFQSAWLDARSESVTEMDPAEEASPEDVQIYVQQLLIYEGYQGWFAILFFFVVLGPEGALAYRLLQLYSQFPEAKLAQRLLFYVDWLPVRLVAATFSLTGDFLASRDELLASFSDASQPGNEVLISTARAALGLKRGDAEGDAGEIATAQVNQIEALLSRCAAFWLVSISLLVLLL